MAVDANMKIIIIDDMQTMLKIQKAMLTKMGFTNIEMANDGAPGWEMIQKAHDDGSPFDFIISDWNMPDMTGLELLKHCRADDRFKTTPFLMVRFKTILADIGTIFVSA